MHTRDDVGSPCRHAEWGSGGRKLCVWKGAWVLPERINAQ
jgi:hypothetical protein